MKKKLLFLVPVLAMVLAGCSPQTPSSSATSAPTTTEGPTSTTSGAPTSESSDPTSVTPTSESTATTPTSQSSGTPTSTPTSESTSEAPEPVPVTGIKMNSPYDVKLKVGETSQIDAEILPENADDKIILYSSTKEAVATVSSTGLITAVGVGTATINVVSHESDTFKKTVNVSVDPEGFLPAAETDDGYSLVTNLSSLSNGDLVKIVGYSAGEPYSIKKDSYDTAEKISYDENDKVVTSNSMEFIFELQMGEGGGYAAIKTYDSANEKYMYIGAKGSSNGIQWYESLAEEKTHLGAELDSEGYATITAAGAKMNTLALNLSGGVYIRFYEPAKAETYRKLCLYRKTPQFYTGISVKTAPDKTNYVEGEEFDPAGMEIQANKNYGDPDPVTEFTYGPAIPLTVEDTEITIYATVGGENFECSQPIVVREKVLSSLEVTTPPDKTVYNIGDAFATEGMVVKAVFNAGVEGFERIDEDFKDYDVSPEYFTTAGEQKVTLSVDGSSAFAEVDVTVNPASLQSIEVTTPPTKLEYYVGDAFDPEGLVITGHYDDESTATIPNSSLEFDPATFTEAGDAVEVKATVKGSEISCQITGITVTAVELDHIEVTAEPTLTEYMVKDELDLAGLEVTAYYNNGDEVVLTADEYTTDPEDGYEFVAADVGTKEITVSFGGEEDTFEVSVEAYNGVKRAYEAAMAQTSGLTEKTYAITGRITFMPGNNLIIQDDDYSICVYKDGASLSTMQVGKMVSFSSKVQKYDGYAETEKISNSIIEVSDETVEIAKDHYESKTEFDNARFLNVADAENLVLTEKPNVVSTADSKFNAKFVGSEEEIQIFVKKSLFNQDAADVLNAMDVGGTFSATDVYKSAYKTTLQIALGKDTVVTDSTIYPVTEIKVTPENPAITLLEESNTVQLSAEVLPARAAEKAVVWSVLETENPAVEVSDSGLVTAKAVGAAHVRATAKDGSGVYGEVVVTVSAGIVPVESVALNPTSSTLAVDGELELEVQFTPENPTNKNVTFESSNSAVATVDSEGKVTAHKPGLATITVTTEDGGFTDTCEITVPLQPSYKKVAEISEGKFVISYGDYVLGNTISNGRATNGSATISGDSFVNPPADSIWEIAKDGDYYTLYNETAGKYLAGTTAKSKAALVDDTSDDHAKWIITAIEGAFEFANLGRSTDASDPANKYLRSNNTSGWACYAAATGGNLSLYKLSEPSAKSTISLDLVSKTIGINDTFTLNATVHLGQDFCEDYSWSSSNSAVATVDDDGLVTGIAEGEATITAELTNGENASCSITVKTESDPTPIVLSTDGGTSASLAKINSDTNNGVKAGTGSVAGKIIVKVPAGSTKLYIHLAGWKGETVKLGISGAGINETNYGIISDDGVTSNSPFTLDGNEEDFLCEFALSGVTSETSISFSVSSGKRFVAWNASVLK